ncbi:MAG: signal peptidase I [Candidatus Bathyarchaeota archaeon]|nr:signal peptidase I [Candidatus Bathyarchaeota archaeon]
MSKLKRALKNEYVKSAIFLAIILGCIGAFWIGLRTYLSTEYPLLAVASGSMIPTLNVGDLIVVQGGLNVSNVIAEYESGDIVVFRKPSNPDELIVHRAVEKINGGLKTKGDNNNHPDYWIVTDDELVGKVVGNIPYLGRVPLFVHTPTGIMIILIVIVVLILLEFVIPIAREKTKAKQPLEETTVSDTEPQ